MKKYKYLLGLMLVLAVIYSIYIFSTKNIKAVDEDKLPSTFESDKYREKLINELLKEDNRPQNRKEIGLIFCNTILSGGIEGNDKSFNFSAGFKKENIDYIPTRSFFVYSLCNGLAEGNSNQSRALKTYFDQRFKQNSGNEGDSSILNILQNERISYKKINPKCDPNFDMNECSYGVLASKIYETLMNDFTNAKVAGTMIANAKVEENAIKKFSNENFGNMDENYYLYKAKIEGAYNYTSHPETYKSLTQLLKSLSEFDGIYIKTNKIQFAPDPDNPEYKDLYLALTDTNYMHFQNLLQREFFWLNMFIGYYVTILPGNTNYVPLRAGTLAGESFNELNWEIAISNDKLAIMSDTIDLTQNMIRNIQTTFPIHIGLQALQEDLLVLRNRLAQLYTPIHQLHYKLINVQDTKRN